MKGTLAGESVGGKKQGSWFRTGEEDFRGEILKVQLEEEDAEYRSSDAEGL